MKIGIIGANSHVGAELMVLLDEWEEITPVGIVRNKIASAFFTARDLPIRVGDVSNRADGEEVLRELDAVVIAARVSPQSVFRTPRGSLGLNKRIIRNVAQTAPPDAPIIFFSSVAAFGNDLYGPVPTGWLYTHEKRVLERTLRKASKEREAGWFALRIGNVFGPFQIRAKQLALALDDSQKVSVAADPDRYSNALHTATLADVIVECSRGNRESGVNPVVNSPRWTWEEIIEYYRPSGTSVEYTGPPSLGGDTSFSSLVDRIVSGLGRAVSMLYYMPDILVRRAQDRYLRSLGESIAAGGGSDPIEAPMFAYHAVPGPFLEPDRSTELHLKEHGGHLEDVFDSALPREEILSRGESPV